MRFTAEQAFEAQAAGDPIWISIDFADQICREHGVSFEEYNWDRGPQCSPIDDIDAADLLEWLGY